jgi:hypothetical protein
MLDVVSDAALDSLGFLVAMNGAGAVCVAVMIASFGWFLWLRCGAWWRLVDGKRWNIMKCGGSGDSGANDIPVMLRCRYCTCHVWERSLVRSAATVFQYKGNVCRGQ